ncbi:uncharacterized protein KGF55_004310 [Candida pseudojiufengensis]|uniref:uncharacterized protein n=1 Tax=Candida pseudojiufengensis TaxID=497109 RepID=UPI0022254CBE|nr:uncharacterized protein KGF55_004310 [Candida pseudojiufengensis]KAI5960740.1 hypothetical protein KGF55_004310 [Candida pseudojiufengensis]
MLSWIYSFFQSPEVTPELKKSIESTINSNKIVIYSKSYCPYCIKAKQIFDKYSVDYKVIELNQLQNGSSIQQGLLDITGQRTVPNIFIDGNHVGGCDQLTQWYGTGKLREVLNKLNGINKESIH